MVDCLHMGIDVGTTAVKAALFEQNGNLFAIHSVESEVIRPHSGHAEQAMDDVWDNVCTCVREVVKSTPTEQVKSIGVCGQGDGLWLLDKHQKPLRNAILWNDQRANDLVQQWIDDGTSDKLSKYSRTAIWPGSSGALLRWISEHEPGIFARAAHAPCCKDWIIYKMTGTLGTDFTDASIPFLDLETRTYSVHAFELLDTEINASDLFSKPKSATDCAGSLTPQIAAQLGLPSDIPVATGCIDVAAMIEGMGLGQTGDVCLILGTTAVLAVIMDPEPFRGDVIGATLAHPYSNKWIRVLAPNCGTSASDWFTSMDATEFEAQSAAETATNLNAVAEKSPPGANGVVFLPFLNGERAPFVAPHAKASFFGITSSTTKSDFSRAVLEGVAFSLRHCFATTGLEKPNQIFLTGGGARNPFWCNILANVMGTRIIASNASDHGLWGAAKLGAAAAGLIDIDESFDRFEDTRLHVPERENINTYDLLYKLYVKNVEAFTPLWSAHKMIMGAPQ